RAWPSGRRALDQYAFDLARAGQPGDEARRLHRPAARLQHVRDAIAHDLERQGAAGDAALQAQHVPAVARTDRLARALPLGQRLQPGLDRLDQLAAPDLAERAVLLRRRAARKGARGGGEGGGVVADIRGDLARPRLGPGPGRLVVALRLDQDVRRLEQVGGAKA